MFCFQRTEKGKELGREGRPLKKEPREMGRNSLGDDRAPEQSDRRGRILPACSGARLTRETPLANHLPALPHVEGRAEDSDICMKI